MCDHVMYVRDVCGVVLRCGLWVSALIILPPPPGRAASQTCYRPKGREATRLWAWSWSEAVGPQRPLLAGSSRALELFT